MLNAAHQAAVARAHERLGPTAARQVMINLSEPYTAKMAAFMGWSQATTERGEIRPGFELQAYTCAEELQIACGLALRAPRPNIGSRTSFDFWNQNALKAWGALFENKPPGWLPGDRAPFLRDDTP